MSTSINDDLVMQFVEMTGSDPDTASYFLELAGHDLESALNLMFSGDIEPPNSTTPPSAVVDDSEEVIREADPVRQQVLLDFSYQEPLRTRETNVGFSRAEDSSVEWLFPPPNHLSFPGTLAEAREVAKKDQKWILVNIQCDKAFSSHLLNRDVWTNETLVSLIRMNFVFWQRGTTSQDGQMFVSMHRLSPELGGEGFPIIGLVDSRTGALISTIKVTAITDANDVILKLMAFLEANDINGLDAPTARPRINSSIDTSLIPPNTDTNEKKCDINDISSSLKSLNLPPPPVVGAVEVVEVLPEETTFTAPSPYANISLEDTAAPTDASVGIKMSLKLTPELVQAIASDTKGKPTLSLVRSFHAQNQTVQHVYASVHYLIQEHSSALPESYRNRSFDLLTAFPRTSLDGKRDITVSEAGLKGAQVIMQWL